MVLTAFFSLIIIFLTLLATTFHLPNLGLFFLLLILIGRQKHFLFLAVCLGLFIYLFGHISFGLTILLLTVTIFTFNWSRENVLPQRKLGGVLLAVTMVVVWEIATYIIF